MIRAKDERVRQVAIGVSILLLLMVTVTSLLLGWRLLPGLLGEWVGTMLGILTTPFLLEASFIVIGLVLVICLNHWRRIKDGDDFVYLEQVTGPEVPEDLPDQAKWAVFREKPLAEEVPSLLTQAEGAVAIGDFSAAAEWIDSMSAEELEMQETLKLRL